MEVKRNENGKNKCLRLHLEREAEHEVEDKGRDKNQHRNEKIVDESL